ncbi:MAG: hypothetical protein M5U34_01395 [Chloroflexi bacterium]|nr:hypothetical protein [Chloroflexota bacterium]
MKKTASLIHKGLALFIAVGVFVQMFLAGVWHSGVVATPDAHVFFGIAMLLASLIALICAAAAGLPKAIIARTGLLFILMLIQPFLMEARRNGLPLLSALHALNAPFIGIVSSTVFAMSRHVAVDEGDELVTSPVSGD